MSLDTPGLCVQELSNINRLIADFGFQWATNAGDLKEKLTKKDRLYKSAIRGMAGEKMTIPEKEATAYAAIEDTAPGLLEEIESLEGKVEADKTRFKALERRASNAQSILSYHRDEAKLSEYVR